MADNICSPLTSNSTVKKNQKPSSHNVINLTTSESLRIASSELDHQLSSQAPESGIFLSHSTPNNRNVNKGGSSFQITSVITGSRMSNGEDSEEDYSRLTDFENETPSYSEDTISKEDVDVFLSNSKQGVNLPVGTNLQNVSIGLSPIVLQQNMAMQEQLQMNVQDNIQDYDINIKVPQINVQYGNNMNINLDSMSQKSAPSKSMTISNDDAKEVNVVLPDKVIISDYKENMKISFPEVNENIARDIAMKSRLEKDFKAVENILNSKLHNDTKDISDLHDSNFSSKDNTLTQEIINTVENAFSKDINMSVENIHLKPQANEVGNINASVDNVALRHNMSLEKQQNDINVSATSNMPTRTDRFKVVKIESTEPFKRGRWICMDYLDKNEYNSENITNNHSNANVNKVYDKSETPEGEGMDSGGSKLGSPVKDNKMTQQNNTMSQTTTHHQSLTPQQMMQCLLINKNNNMNINQDNVNVQGQSMPTEFFNDKYVNQPSVIQNPMSSSTGPPVSMPNQQQHNTNEQNISQYYTGQIHTSMNTTIPTSNNVSMASSMNTNINSIPIASQGHQTMPHVSNVTTQSMAGATMNIPTNIQNMTNVQQGMSLPSNINQMAAQQQSNVNNQQQNMNHPMGVVNQQQMNMNQQNVQQMSQSQNVSQQVNTQQLPQPQNLNQQLNINQQNSQQNLITGQSVSQQVSGGLNVMNQMNQNITGGNSSSVSNPTTNTASTSANINVSTSNTNLTTHKPSVNHASGSNTEAIAREKLLEAVVIVGTSGGGSTEDGDSTGTTNAVAIDNKIEQAMDLVKSHLMFAVREEVEVLKEKISELMERINMLELENGILRAHATQETLAQLKTTPAAMSGPAVAGSAPGVANPAGAPGATNAALNTNPGLMTSNAGGGIPPSSNVITSAPAVGLPGPAISNTSGTAGTPVLTGGSTNADPRISGANHGAQPHNPALASANTGIPQNSQRIGGTGNPGQISVANNVP